MRGSHAADAFTLFEGAGGVGVAEGGRHWQGKPFIHPRLMLLRDGRIGLVQAAGMVGVSASEVIDICADHQVSLARYPAEELAEVIGQFQDTD